MLCSGCPANQELALALFGRVQTRERLRETHSSMHKCVCVCLVVFVLCVLVWGVA
jgi:hypothetical protein